MLGVSRVLNNAAVRTFRRYVLAALLVTALFVSLLALPTLAQDRFGVSYGEGAGLSTQDVRVTVVNIIRVSLGVLGTIFLGFIVYGGVTWMTAGGSAEQVEKAKKIITNATIGLVVIFLAFAIASFVLRKLEEVAGGGLPGGGVPVGGLPPGGGAGFNAVAVSPPDAASGVKLCAAVQAIFNANLAPATVNASHVTVREIGGTASGGTFAVNGNSFSFSHPDFAPNAAYEAAITTDVQSLSGAYLERERVWTFKTGTESDDVPPRVVAVYPPSGGTNVCLAAPVQVVFSEEMNVGTLTAAQVVLEKEAGGAWIGVPLASVAPGTDFVSFAAYPVGGFAANTRYRVTLLPGITDTCGIPLDGNGNGTADGPSDVYDSSAAGPWTFTSGTTAECAPFISSVAPSAAYYSDEVVAIRGDYFFLGAGSDAYFNNFAADQNCFNAQAVPNAICRAGWGDHEIRVRVPAGSTSGPLTVDVGGRRSNAVNFQVLSPYVGALSPNAGPVGSFVTLFGAHFGTVRGRVEFTDPVTGNKTLAEFPCTDNWFDGSVVIRVPSGLSPGTYPVQLFTAPPGNRPSNRLSFTVNTGPLAPGVCTRAPSCGVSGTSVSLGGERFGGSQASSAVSFGTLIAAASPWSDTAVTAAAPVFPGSGNYPIAVTVQGLRSNELPFDTPCAPSAGSCDSGVIDAGEQCDGVVPPPSLSCAAPAIGTWQCDAGCNLTGCTGGGGTCNNNTAEGSEQCDGSDLRGLTCTTYGGAFSGGTLGCNLSCGFNTSGCTTPADEPKVIEQAGCSESLQSPSPFRDTNDACRNVNVSVTFDRDMNDATFADIAFVSCGNGATFAPALCTTTPLAGTASTADAGGGREAYVLTPSVSALAPDTWYRVTVPATVASAAGVALSGPYEWHFRTRPSLPDNDGTCSPDRVSVAPRTAVITSLGGTQVFRALPAAGNCNMLTGAFTYAWDSSDKNKATVGGSVSDRETATALKETEGASVDISAQIAAGVKGAAALSIVFDPLFCTTSEDCKACGAGKSACVNSQCTPVAEDVAPSPSPVGSWVTISGCYFGVPQGRVIYGGGAEGRWPDPAVCGSVFWTNTQILSEVPDAATADPGDDAVSGIVTVRRPDGAEAISQGSFTVGGGPRPDLCRIDPVRGAIGSGFVVRGRGFGDARAAGDAMQFGATALAPEEYRGWAATEAEGRVPAGLVSGATAVALINDGARSNPLAFTVSGGGLNDPCDGSADIPQCQADDGRCSRGLFCDPNIACTCQLAPGLRVMSALPAASALQCPNGMWNATFDARVDLSSVSGETVWLQRQQGVCEAGREPSPVSGWWERVKRFARSVVPFARAQGAVLPQVWCAVPDVGLDLRLEHGNFIGDAREESRLVIAPQEALALDAVYRIVLRGGDQGVKSAYGTPLVTLNGTFTAAGETFEGYAWQAATDDHLCQIARVSVTTTKGRGALQTQAVTNRDTFVCAGRNDCPDDARDAPGSQHGWTAQAWDASQPPVPLSASYHWTPHDPGSLITLSDTESAAIDATAAAANGTAYFEVGAHSPAYGAATTTVSATISLCENPWPGLASFPYTDATYQFSLWYCRDAGAAGTADDLPALKAPVVEDTSPDPRLLREYLFLRDGTRDAIGLRVYENQDRLSLREWYQQNAALPGAPGDTAVNGFPAFRDGRSLYVLAPNISGAQFFTNVFVLSYNEGAEVATAQIMEGLAAHWAFALNVAASDQPALVRDVQRISDLGTIRALLLAYAEGREEPPGYPVLEAGSYQKGYSTSRWPSWQAALGNVLGRALPTDPVNAFPRACSGGANHGAVCAQDAACGEGGACVISGCPAPAFDQASCWNDQAKQFVCSAGSRLYAYESVNGGTFAVGTNLESISLSSGGGAVGACQMNYLVRP